MRSPSLWDDLNNPFEIVFRLGGRLLGLVICCAFAYQAYDALRSATLGVNPNGSAPVANPKSGSSRFGGLAWGLISLAIALLGFGGILGFDVISVLLYPFARN